LRGVTLEIAEGEFVRDRPRRRQVDPAERDRRRLLGSGSITMDGTKVTGLARTSPADFRWCGRTQRLRRTEHRGKSEVGTGMRAISTRSRRLESVYAEFPMLPIAVTPRRHALRRPAADARHRRALMTAPRIMAIDEPSLASRPRSSSGLRDPRALRAQRKLTLLIVEQSSTRA